MSTLKPPGPVNAINAIRDIMENDPTAFVKKLSSKIVSLGCITVWKILSSDLGPQILVEISRWLLDQPR